MRKPKLTKEIVEKYINILVYSIYIIHFIEKKFHNPFVAIGNMKKKEQLTDMSSKYLFTPSPNPSPEKYHICRKKFL